MREVKEGSSLAATCFTLLFLIGSGLHPHTSSPLPVGRAARRAWKLQLVDYRVGRSSFFPIHRNQAHSLF